MNDITIRFIEIYNHLLETKKVSNPSDFAKKIEISSSMMNEILKGRSNAGINPIQNTVKTFNSINSEWLLTGKGNMLKNLVGLTEEPTNFREQLDDKNKIITFQDEKIQKLEEEITQLKKAKEASEHNMHVAEPEEKLRREPKNK